MASSMMMVVFVCLLAFVAFFLHGCGDNCKSDGGIEVCCPSKKCKNDKQCCQGDDQGTCTIAEEVDVMLNIIKDKVAKCPDGCSADAEKIECRPADGSDR
eukprot:TRINITY_DN52836_c0_g1_i1.p1 TRINITY_DN52836_c0_g1~~TRINITY_DN52836_c0_g1_i1.p1  ORF type:complete len:116 (+),score=22.31 TRINITY_DN52836_c0_g1_i1:51-350(+)